MRQHIITALLLAAAACGESEAPSIVVESRDLGPLEQASVIQGRDGGYSPPIEKRVMMRTSPALTGPWSPAMEAFETLEPGEDGHFAYSGLGHAELARDGGRFEYVSYYRGTEPWFGEIRLVEVDLGL